MDTAGGSAVDTGQASPMLARLVVGRTLRRLREDRGLSREQAGDAIGLPGWMIGHIELGEAGLRLRDVADLCILYGRHDQIERATLLGLARRANGPEWWHPYRDVIPAWFVRYLALEQAASVIRSFAVQVIPGLLQTPDYARAVLLLGHGGAPDQQIERQVELSIRRQEMLRRPQPVHLWTVIDEAALRRPMGGKAAMRAQLRHLIGACEMANVTLGVLPFRLGGHPAIGGPVAVLRLRDRQLPDVAYLEQLASGRYVDEPGVTDYYRHVLNRLALQAESAGPAQVILSGILREI